MDLSEDVTVVCALLPGLELQRRRSLSIVFINVAQVYTYNTSAMKQSRYVSNRFWKKTMRIKFFRQWKLLLLMSRSVRPSVRLSVLAYLAGGGAVIGRADDVTICVSRSSSVIGRADGGHVVSEKVSFVHPFFVCGVGRQTPHTPRIPFSAASPRLGPSTCLPYDPPSPVRLSVRPPRRFRRSAKDFYLKIWAKSNSKILDNWIEYIQRRLKQKQRYRLADRTWVCEPIRSERSTTITTTTAGLRTNQKREIDHHHHNHRRFANQSEARDRPQSPQPPQVCEPIRSER